MKYWRIRFGTSTGGTSEDIWLAEVTLKNAVGTDISVGGAASASSVYDSIYSATYAFDKNLTNAWASEAGQFPCWIRYELASAERVESIVLVAPSNQYSSDELPVPDSIFVEHSENGVDWVTATSLTQSGSFSPGATVTLSGFVFPGISAYAASATPLGAPAVLALQHPLAARIAAPTPLGAAQALAEFNGTSKARLSAASPLGQPTAVAVAVMQATARADTPLGAVAAVAVAITPVEAHAAAATPLGAVQALAYAPPMGKAAAPTPLGDVQITAFAMVAGYAASPTPLGQPAALAFADMEALGTVGQNTTFGAPAVVLVNRVQDGIRLAEFIPPLTALQGMAPGSMTAQASSLPSPAFGTPAVQFATSHEAASLESVVAFGAPAVRSIHPADSFAPAQFGDVGAPAFAAHAASLQDGPQFGQPLASTLHALPDWYAGLRFGAVAVQGTGVFPVLDGIELGEFGQPDLGATRHQAMPLHMLPQFGPVTISRGAMTC